MVIVPAPGVIVTFAPAVKLAATGVAPVDPIMTWPFVIVDDQAGTPVELVTNTALLAVANPVTVFAPLEYKRLLAV